NPDWSQLYSGQEEILRYLVSVAEEYHLTNYIRFSTSVVEASWNDKDSKWRVAVDVNNAKDAETRREYILTADFMISAVGQLNNPSIPNVPGLEDFTGKIMHTARWDWTYDYKNKNVAVVGNGASGIQVVPAIADDVQHITVFQRTPSYIISRGNMGIPGPLRRLMKIFPPLLWALRQGSMDIKEASYHTVMRPKTELMNIGAKAAAALLRCQLSTRPDLWEPMTPRYTFGCKRVLISDDYYPTFQRDKVELVPHAVDKITRKGVVSDGKEYGADMIILATGFKTLDFMAGIKLYGKNGRSLQRDVWKKAPCALYGVTVGHMPNFAMLYGPNTNLGHNSIILMIEAQMGYTIPLIKEVLHARQSGQSLQILPRLERIGEYNEELQRKLAQTSMADSKCQSWYKNDEGLVINNWPGTVVEYQKLMATVKWDDFIFEDTAAAMLEQKKRGRKTNVGYVHEDSISRWKTAAMYPLLGLAVYQGLKWNNPDLFKRAQGIIKELIQWLPQDIFRTAVTTQT
ncbi:hypothetical protein KEM54_003038, partial [Ascosphaera aggregata]